MSRSLHQYWDTFTTNPGEESSTTCATCGSAMEVTRSVDGPTGWAEAMGGGKHVHDRWTCPHAGVEWHEDVRKLLQAMEKTPSKKLRALMQSEVDEYLAREGKK